MDEPEYFTQEGFESFVCWLKLPALIAVGEGSGVQTKAAQDVTVVAANLAYAGKVAGYEVHRFLDVLRAGDLKKRREPEIARVERCGGVAADEKSVLLASSFSLLALAFSF